MNLSDWKPVYATIVVVETFAHDLTKMNHNIPRFMDEHITRNAVLHLKIEGMKFFRANAAKLLEQMTSLAAREITIYPHRAGGKEPRQAFRQNKPASN